MVLYLLSELGLLRSVLGPMNYSKKRLSGQSYISSYKFRARTALDNYKGTYCKDLHMEYVGTKAKC